MLRMVSFTFNLSSLTFQFGGLAQLARAPALHAGGQRFESVILHAREKDRRSQSLQRNLEFNAISEVAFLNRSLTYCTIILQANLE